MNGFEGEQLYMEAEARKKEKREIRYFATCAALPIIGYVVLSNIIVFALELLGIRRFVAGNTLANECFSLLATVIAIFVPFLCSAFFEKRKTDFDIAPLDRPEKLSMMILAVPAGLAFCLIGSIVTGWISIIFSMFGTTLTQPPISAPPTGYALLVYVIRLTVSAAVVEEVCFRGVVMQPLRKYGNFFAIAMSSLLFALMHGNLVQAPSALISGFAIGYFTIATGTIWTGVLIHLSNNAIVAVAQYFLTSGNEDAAYLISGAVSEVVMSLGLICFLVFALKRKTLRLNGAIKMGTLSPSRKFTAYIFNPAMIITIALMLYTMTAYME